MRKEHRILKTRKFFRNKSVVIGAAVLLIMLALAVLAPVISPYDPLEVNVVNRLKSPCKEFIFGTDTFGRDLLSRILYGTSISMKVGVLVSGFVCDRPVSGPVFRILSQVRRCRDALLRRSEGDPVSDAGHCAGGRHGRGRKRTSF